ncbi:unnamed protein product [Effrenium voratum]|nr:unnamed protein product [Effrenium voratum]
MVRVEGEIPWSLGPCLDPPAAAAAAAHDAQAAEEARVGGAAAFGAVAGGAARLGAARLGAARLGAALDETAAGGAARPDAARPGSGLPAREEAKTEEKEPEAKADDDDGAEITTAIIDGIPRSSGENTYRAEVNVPRENGSGPLGKRGLTAIRGPNRIDKGKAEDDVRLLVDAFKRGGPPEVRKQQKELNRSWVN